MAFSGDGNALRQANRVLRQPARIVIDPTGPTSSDPTDFPFGGTYLGILVRGAILFATPKITPLICQNESGQVPYAHLYSGWKDVELKLELAEWNNNVLQVAFPGLTVTPTGLPPQERKIQALGALNTGRVADAEYVTVAVIPDDLINHKALIFRDSMMVLDSDLNRVRWRTLAYGSFAVAFLPRKAATTPVLNEELFVVGKWEDLEL